LFSTFSPLKAGVLGGFFSTRAIFVCTIGAVTGLLVLASWRMSLVTGSSRNSSDVKPADLGRDIPWHVEPLVRPIFAKDSPEAVWTNRVLQEQSQGPLNVSYCCHLLRLYGLGRIPHPRFVSGREIVAVLTDQRLSKSEFGQPIFFQTRNGIRYRDLNLQKIPAGENHRDFCLATFAELGLPLSTPITILEQSFSIRDLLQDSVENFDIRQEELPWTAVAYALYLAPQRQWTNRFGESFDFDELVSTLMEVPLDRASCGGTHLLYALTIVSRVDSSMAYLSDLVRQRVFEYLRKCTMIAANSQHTQGYWPWDWHTKDGSDPDGQSASPRDVCTARLVVTGHLLEWLEMLPVEVQPPAQVYRSAARCMCEMLRNDLRRADFDGFCPRVHALCAIRALIMDE
jgi:hypothetical protein